MKCQECKKELPDNSPWPFCDHICADKQGYWMDPAGGIHSNDEEDPAEMYK